jgi:hypothetical protein
MSFRSLALISVSASLFPLFAQTSRGTVNGLVTDSSGAVIAAAQIELRNQETGVARSTESNAAGIYRFDAVDPGVYDLTAKLAGFKVSTVRGSTVQAGQVTTLDVRLEVGEAATTVEVTDSGVALQTEAPVRGGNISTQQITQLPVAFRNPTLLALTLPGVSSNRFGRGIQTFVVNGARNRSNNFLLDGTENNDISVAGQGLQIQNPDAVQEVSIQTGNYDAEFGRAGGAVVNVITKSGTNSYHGSASYLLDSTVDDAITSTQSLSPAIRERGRPPAGTEQWFSGTFGGRIVRDKTFFFQSYQDRRQNSQSSTTVRALSPRGRATLNSLFPAGSNRNVDLFNALSAAAGDATANFFDVPLGLGRPAVEFGSLLQTYAQTRTDRQWLTKVDHRLSDNDQLSFRYAGAMDDRPVGGETTSYNGLFTSQKNRYQNGLIAHTHVFSPSLTNEARASFNRIDLSFPLDPANPLGLTAPELRIQGITTDNVFAIGVTSPFPQGRVANNYVLQDTMTWVKGRHTLRFGFDLLEQRSRQFAPIVERGRLTYNATAGAAGTFSGFANFVDDFSGAAGVAERTFGDPAYYPELFRQAYFLQDRWRVTPSLTLSLGVRYENFGNPVNSVRTAAWAGLFNIDPATFDGPYRNANKVASDNNNIAPMVGFAWSPSATDGWLGRLAGEKKLVVRGGYGIGYDSFFNNIASNAQGSAPNVVATTFTSVTDANNPRGQANLSSFIPTTPRAVTPLDAQTLVPGNLVNPYYQRWSLGIQRELPASLLLDISYVGTKGTKLYLNEQMNPTVPTSLQVIPQTSSPIPSSRLNNRLDALQGSRLIRGNGGDSNYHSLQMLVTRRLARGLSGSASYTWSKLIDNGGDVFSITQANQTQNPGVPPMFAPGGLRWDRAVSVYDRTQRAVFSFVYELPGWKAQQGILGRVLGGWQVSSLMTFESGVPLNITNGGDADGLDGAGDRPDYNPAGQRGVRAVPNRTSPTGYVNPDAGNAPIDPMTAEFIGLPTQSGADRARTGNLGRNVRRTPGLSNFDVNLTKNIRIVEGWNLEFRSEFYNFFNHPMYGYPSVSPFAPGGGEAPTAGNIAAAVNTSPAGQFLQPQFVDGGGRVIRYQLRLRF